ncbi:unnamed protein product [Malus baccata var. baccata]
MHLICETRALRYSLVRRRDGMRWDGTGRDGTEQNGTDDEEVEQKISQISSHGTTRSTVFRRTKRGTERLVPFRPVPSHVPNTHKIRT